jgi:hypothetical protein
MNSPTPSYDHEALREALRRDAARVPQPAFDPALHHATMRRIRALAEPKERNSRFHLLPVLATAAALLLLTALLALPWRHPAPKREIAAVSAALQVAPAATLLAYQSAAGQGDDALLAALDRDGRKLLPATPPAFNSALR